MIRPVRFITLDLFETCICIRPSVSFHYKRVAEEFGVTLNLKRVEENFWSVYARFKREYPLIHQSKDWWHRVACTTINLSTVGSTNPNLVGKVSEKLYQEFETSRCWHVYPDAVQFLDFCSKYRVPLAGVSNFDERLPTLLSNLELEKYFLFVLAQANKPDTTSFRIALDRAGYAPIDSCHVGDSISEDCKPAMSVGMRAVLISRREDEESIAQQLDNSGINQKDVIVIRSLAELQEKIVVE